MVGASQVLATIKVGWAGVALDQDNLGNSSSSSMEVRCQETSKPPGSQGWCEKSFRCLWEDLQDQPLESLGLTLFTDGSSYYVNGKQHTGYAVVRNLEVLEAEPLQLSSHLDQKVTRCLAKWTIRDLIVASKHSPETPQKAVALGERASRFAHLGETTEARGSTLKITRNLWFS
ncbi:protein NYNRIN-like [Grus japonensis]|uniref:Protein NYNRIN-like n=1 Tax=Grus japonensis TaxID=30415 RepID=A0ABC9XBB8_GRUJA